MQNKYRKHWQFLRWSPRERRLCFDADAIDRPPDHLDNLPLPENQERVIEMNEQDRRDIAQIESVLLAAIQREGNMEMLKLYEDPQHHKRMISFVKKEAHRLRFLPQNAPGLALLQDNKYETPTGTIDGYKQTLERSVTSMINFIQGATEDLDAVAGEYDGDIDVSALKTALESLNTRDLLQKRQDLLVDVGVAVTRAVDSESLRGNIESVFIQHQERVEALRTGHPAIATLQKDLLAVLRTRGIRFDDAQRKMQDILSKAAPIAYSAEVTETLNTTLATIDKELTGLDEAGRLHLEEVFERQKKYLDQFGSHPEALVKGATLKDGTISVSLLVQTLAILDVLFDAEELKAKVAEGKDPLIAYLRDDLKLNDTVPSYIRGLYLRSRLPDGVSAFLMESKMPVRVGDLVTIAGIPELTEEKDGGKVLTKKALDTLFELVAERDTRDGVTPPKFTIEKTRFVEALSVLYIKADGSKNNKDIAAEARENAVRVWNGFAENAGKEGANSVTAVDLRTAFDESISVPEDVSIEMHKQMRDNSVQDISWAKNVQEYAGTLLTNTKEAVPKWTAYMKNLTSVVSDDDDAALLRIINNRSALLQMKKVIEEGLSRTDRATDDMKQILSDSTAESQRTQRLRQGVDIRGAAVKSKEFDEQALILAKSYFYAHTELRNTGDIDSLDQNVQDMAFWIALEKTDPQNPGNPLAGLKEAQRFILEFNNAPNHRSRLDEAHKAFMGEMQLPEGVAPTQQTLAYYKRCLENFQMTAHITEDVYKTYANAIDGVFNSFKAPTTQQKVDVAINILTMAMDAYYKEADIFEQRRRASYDPGLFYRESFLSGVYGNLTDEQQKSFDVFKRKFEMQEENEGRDNLSWLWNKHRLAIKPPAIQLLAKKKVQPNVPGLDVEGLTSDLLSGSYSMDRWLNAGELQASEEPLRLILDGTRNPEGKDALIRAYIQGRDVPYRRPDMKPTDQPIIMTRQDALRAVRDIRTRLKRQSESYPISLQLGKDYERHFQNPIERAFRASVETMQEIWSGDMIDKAKVFAIGWAAFTLLRKVWKDGMQEGSSPFLKGLALSIPGLAILVGVNDVIKRQTGRDVLGEELLYLSPRLRNSMLEQWRREAVKIGLGRYDILGQNAGIAAVSELSDEDCDVSVDDLNEWRRNMNSGAYSSYEAALPTGVHINVSTVRYHLGVNGTKEEAYEVFFLAFEALCASVASLHSRSGTLDSKAQWGANYIQRRYIDFSGQFDDPELQEELMKGDVTMGQVIHWESMVASKSGKEIRTKVESLDEARKSAIETAGQKLTQLKGTFSQTKRQTVEFSEDLYTDGKRLVLSTADSVYDWFRVSYEKGKFVTVENFDKTFRAIGDVLVSVGGTIVQDGPEFMEWTFDIATYGVEKSKAAALNIYRMLLSNGVTGPVIETLRKSFEKIFDMDIDQFTKTEEYVEQISEYSEAKTLLIEELDTVCDDMPEDMDSRIDAWMTHLIAVDADIDTITSLNARQRLLYLEQLKRQIFSYVIASRVEEIDLHGDALDYNKVAIPLSIQWPEATEKDFDLAVSENGDVGALYKYIKSHYNPMTVSALMGNQEMMENTLKRWRDIAPNSYTGTAAEFLLNIGAEHVLGRSDASKYLGYELAEYTKPFLQQAEKELNEAHFKQYKEYMNTLVTNVIIETVLDSESPEPQDLFLMAHHAKDMLKHLFVRRGIAPSVEEMKKEENVKLLDRFEVLPVQEPKVLKDLLRNKRKRWLLRGAEVGEAEEEVLAQTGVAAPLTPKAIAVDQQQKIAAKDLGALPKLDVIEKQLEVLRVADDPAIRTKIQQKIDEAYTKWKNEGKLTDPPDDKQRPILPAILSGLPDASPQKQEIEKQLRDAYTAGSAEMLAEISTFDMRDRNEKVANLFNRIVLDRLQNLVTDIVTKLDKITFAKLEEKLDLTSQKKEPELVGTFAAWEQELLELYRMTNRPINSDDDSVDTTEELTDAVSRLLEFVLYRGDNHKEVNNKNKFDKYTEYLKQKDFINIPDDLRLWYEYVFGRGKVRSPKRMELDLSGSNTPLLKQVVDTKKILDKLESSIPK